MNKAIYLLGIIAVGVGLTAFDFKGSFNLGESAPLQERMMDNVVGDSTSLANAKGENGLLVIFSCNTCPYVHAWEDQYGLLNDSTKKYDIGMMLVNSNTKKRDNEDSREAMASHAAHNHYAFPYVIDRNNELADAFGAQTTPHVFLLDGDLNLVFEGSINNLFENPDQVASDEWLKKAIHHLGTGHAERINPADTRQTGCSIKRI